MQYFFITYKDLERSLKDQFLTQTIDDYFKNCYKTTMVGSNDNQ